MGEPVYVIVGGLVLLQVLQCLQLVAILRAVRRNTLRPPPPVGMLELETPLEAIERPTPWRRIVESVRPRQRRRRRRTHDDGG